MAADRIVYEWQDAAGGFIRCAGWLDGSASVAPVGAALAGASNTQLLYATAGIPFVSTSPAVAGETWWLTTDTMVLLFRCADGGTVQLVIPGPLEACFKADGLTVDPASVPMAPLIAAVVGAVTNNAGSLVTAFISGVRSSRRTEQNTGS